MLNAIIGWIRRGLVAVTGLRRFVEWREAMQFRCLLVCMRRGLLIIHDIKTVVQPSVAQSRTSLH